jgi:quinol monooxygenase YgiN
MTYAFTMDVAQPVEAYERVHSALMQRLGRELPTGCLVHLATKTEDGFRVIEVWESREASDRFNEEVMRPLIVEVSGIPQDVVEQGPPPTQELQVLGLTVDERALASA